MIFYCFSLWFHHFAASSQSQWRNKMSIAGAPPVQSNIALPWLFQTFTMVTMAHLPTFFTFLYIFFGVLFFISLFSFHNCHFHHLLEVHWLHLDPSIPLTSPSAASSHPRSSSSGLLAQNCLSLSLIHI